MSVRRAAVLLLAALAAPACMTGSPADFGFPASDSPGAEGWVVSEPFRCLDADVLWETAKVQAVKPGYLIDDDATSYKRRQVVTRWKIDLANARYTGKRARRYVELLPEEGKKDIWRVRVSTVIQRNADLIDPLNPAKAEWRRAGPDPEDAEFVVYGIESQFRDLGPSPEFEMR